MKLPTLDHYIRQMRNSPYSLEFVELMGMSLFMRRYLKDWFDYKIFHENEAVIA